MVISRIIFGDHFREHFRDHFSDHFRWSFYGSFLVVIFGNHFQGIIFVDHFSNQHSSARAWSKSQPSYLLLGYTLKFHLLRLNPSHICRSASVDPLQPSSRETFSRPFRGFVAFHQFSDHFPFRICALKIFSSCGTMISNRWSLSLSTNPVSVVYWYYLWRSVKFYWKLLFMFNKYSSLSLQ